MAPRLVPLDEGPVIRLDYPVIFVGRHPDCDVRIKSRKISRRHCCIALVENRIVIRDLGSTNGIRVNGKRVSEAELGPNDIVMIAHLRYQYLTDEELGQAEQVDADARPLLDHASGPED